MFDFQIGWYPSSRKFLFTNYKQRVFPGSPVAHGATWSSGYSHIDLVDWFCLTIMYTTRTQNAHNNNNSQVGYIKLIAGTVSHNTLQTFRN